MMLLHPRKQIHLPLSFAFQSLLSIVFSSQDTPKERKQAFSELENIWSKVIHKNSFVNEQHDVFIGFSVRSSLDCFLRTFANNEQRPYVCMSAVNIADMGRVVIENGFIPIPIDVDEDTFAPRIDLFQQAVELLGGNKISCLLFAHLFGSEIPQNIVNQFVDICEKHGILVLEDCAQAFAGFSNGFYGSERTHLKMFSFGSIKTASTYTGSVCFLNRNRIESYVQRYAPDLSSKGSAFSQLKKQHANLSFQTKKQLTQKIVKTMALALVLKPIPLGTLYRILNLMNIELDETLRNMSRGFDPNKKLTEQIRLQPNTHLLKLMIKRFTTLDQSAKGGVTDRTWERAAMGHYASSLLPIASDPPPLPLYFKDIVTLTQQKPLDSLGRVVVQPARKSSGHNYWLFPIFVADPKAVAKELTGYGFDVTSGASHLDTLKIPTPENYTKLNIEVPDQLKHIPAELHDILSPRNAQYLIERIVYLPVYAEMKKEDIQTMIGVLTKYLKSRSTDSQQLLSRL
jgi:perosamine synthetase